MKKWISKITDIFKSKSYVQRRSFNSILKNGLFLMKYTEIKHKNVARHCTCCNLRILYVTVPRNGMSGRGFSLNFFPIMSFLFVFTAFSVMLCSFSDSLNSPDIMSCCGMSSLFLPTSFSHLFGALCFKLAGLILLCTS